MILTSLLAILPTFALIIIGYGLKRIGYVSEVAAKGLPEFAFKVALPAMLFKAIGTAAVPQAPSLAILGAYFGAAAMVWLIVTAMVRWVLRLPASDAPALAMASTFSNVAILGVAFTVMLAQSFGNRVGAPVLALILAFDALILWFAATLHHAAVETREVGQQSAIADLKDVGVRVITNPLIIASLAGLIWQHLGLALDSTIDRILSLIGAAGVPAALFAIGMAIAGFGVTSAARPLSLILVAKLVLFPAITYGLATMVFTLPQGEAAIVTLFSGMPVGVNAYLFAAGIKRAEAPISAAIAISTPLSAVTLTTLALLLGLIGNRP